MIVRSIPGNWNKSLNTSYRFGSNISNIAIKFQKSVFGHKYRSDELNVLSQIDFEERIIEYHFFQSFTSVVLFNTIYNVLLKNIIHSSDVGILCSKVEILRDLDFMIRTSKNERTTTTYESQEEFTTIKNDETKKLIERGIPEKDIKLNINKAMHDRLECIRKIRKNHFWMKTGTIKLSTVHSFKGWEINTLFLIIENEEDEDKQEFTNAELIYTGLTRAKRNLIVFNLGNEKYDNFFKNEIETQYKISELL